MSPRTSIQVSHKADGKSTHLARITVTLSAAKVIAGIIAMFKGNIVMNTASEKVQKKYNRRADMTALEKIQEWSTYLKTAAGE